MPSIEIICIGQRKPSRFRGVPFVVAAGSQLISHRLPSHFQKDFDKLRGCIYHLGSLKHKGKRGGFFTAYDLLSEECHEQESTIILEFQKPFVPHLQRVLRALLLKAHSGKIVFTSDYQGSDNRPKRFKEHSFEDFWLLHERRQLRFNALYVISMEGKTKETRK